jgi:hypothetical protein
MVKGVNVEIPTQEQIEQLKRQYLNKRVRLDYTGDPYTDLKPGAEGQVWDIDALGQLQIKWDSGSTLAMIPGVDKVSVIS